MMLKQWALLTNHRVKGSHLLIIISPVNGLLTFDVGHTSERIQRS